MKRTKYLLSTVLAVSLLGFSSCDDYLDKLPDNRMELKSTDDVSNLLVVLILHVILPICWRCTLTILTV